MKRDIRSLTGLRGVAACLVMVYHLGMHKIGTGPILLFINHGYLAVDFFFVLSGYVMALTYASSFASSDKISAYCAFIWKRWAWVWPLYAVVTLAAALETRNVQSSVLLANFGMVQSWGITYSLLGQGWSISTELAAYLLFPVLLAMTIFCDWGRAACAAVLSACVLAGLVFLPPELTHIIRYSGPLDFPDSRTAAPVLRCVSEFTLGLLAWRLARTEAGRQISANGWFSGTMAAALLVLLAVPGTDLAVVLTVPFFLISIAEDTGLVARVLATRLCHGLGTISYALYLVHIPPWVCRTCLEGRVRHIGVAHAWTATFLMLVGAALVTAILAHVLIEKPSRVALRRLSDIRWRRPGTASLDAPTMG